MCNCYFATPCLISIWVSFHVSLDSHVSETWSGKIAIAHQLLAKSANPPLKYGMSWFLVMYLLHSLLISSCFHTKKNNISSIAVSGFIWPFISGFILPFIFVEMDDFGKSVAKLLLIAKCDFLHTHTHTHYMNSHLTANKFSMQVRN